MAIPLTLPFTELVQAMELVFVSIVDDLSTELTRERCKIPAFSVYDPRVGSVFEFDFGCGEVLSIHEVRRIALVSSFSRVTGSGRCLGAFVNMISRVWKAQIVLVTVIPTDARRRVIIAPPPQWRPILTAPPGSGFQIQTEQITEIAPVFETVKTRARWIFEFAGDGSVIDGTNRTEPDFTLKFFAASVQRNTIPMVFDTDDDFVLALLPLSREFDGIVSELFAAGIASVSPSDLKKF